MLISWKVFVVLILFCTIVSVLSLILYPNLLAIEKNMYLQWSLWRLGVVIYIEITMSVIVIQFIKITYVQLILNCCSDFNEKLTFRKYSIWREIRYYCIKRNYSSLLPSKVNLTSTFLYNVFTTCQKWSVKTVDQYSPSNFQEQTMLI